MATFLDLCAGVGGFRMAAEQLNHKCVGYVEFDKFPRCSYEAIYDTEGEWTRWDLTEVTNEEWESLKGKVDFITAGFPCQAFSVAGKQLGFKDTRGTVFFDVARAIKHVSPPYFILENVKNLISHDKGKTIDTIIRTLNEIGYTVDYTILNSKYFDVPQNRERVFIVGIKNGKTEEWKIEGNNALAKSKRRIASYKWAKTFNFDWPKHNVVTKQLIDILEPEENIPSNLYLSPEKTRTLIKSILERDEELGRTDALRMLGLLDIKGRDSIRRVYDSLGISPTLTTMAGGNTEPKVMVAGNINPSGRGIGGQVYHAEGLSPTINAGHEGGKQIVYSPELVSEEIKDFGNVNPSQNGTDGMVYEAENGITPALSTNKGEGAKIAYCPIITPDKIKSRQNGRRIKNPGEEMFTLTAQDRHGILMYEVPQKVLVRKYEVNKEKLSNILREHKKKAKLINKQIAEKLNLPETLVSHWFRKDKSFSIPNPVVWYQLKELLNIETDEFDTPITEFEEKESTYEKSNCVYDSRGISPTLTCSNTGETIFDRYVVRKLTPRECWRLQAFPDWAFDRAKEVNSNSQLYKQAGNSLTVTVAYEIIKRLIP